MSQLIHQLLQTFVLTLLVDMHFLSIYIYILIIVSIHHQYMTIIHYLAVPYSTWRLKLIAIQMHKVT